MIVVFGFIRFYSCLPEFNENEQKNPASKPKRKKGTEANENKSQDCKSEAKSEKPSYHIEPLSLNSNTVKHLPCQTKTTIISACILVYRVSKHCPLYSIVCTPLYV